jgi:hypothetical protein
MLRISAVIALFFFGFAGRSAKVAIEGPSLVGAPNLADTLIGLEKQSWVAWKKRDGAFFQRFLADDHVEIGSSGVAGKKAVVSFVGSQACVVASYLLDHFTVTPIDRDVAALTYRAVQKTTCGKSAVPSPVWVSSVFVRRQGKWLDVLYQQTPVTSQ